MDPVQEQLDAYNARDLERFLACYAPDAWLNWQLLGNYLSDAGRFDEAAYRSALACEQVWADSIHLNQAILAERQGDSREALLELRTRMDHDRRVHRGRMRAGVLRRRQGESHHRDQG